MSVIRIKSVKDKFVFILSYSLTKKGGSYSHVIIHAFKKHDPNITGYNGPKVTMKLSQIDKKL